MKLKWGLIGILIGILSACQSSNQPMDITYPQPSINIPAEGQKPPIDPQVEIKTPVFKIFHHFAVAYVFIQTAVVFGAGIL